MSMKNLVRVAARNDVRRQRFTDVGDWRKVCGLWRGGWERLATTVFVGFSLAGCSDAFEQGRAPATIEIVPASQTVEEGLSIPFSTKVFSVSGEEIDDPTVIWSATNPSIASLDGRGMALGLAPGFTAIVATVATVADTATLQVVVLEPNVEIDPDTSLQLKAGDSVQFVATVYSQSGREIDLPIKWSSNGHTVSIDSTGLAVALVAGQGVISAILPLKDVATTSVSTYVEYLDLQRGNGGHRTCGITTDHELYCWGDNNHGEFGIGTQTWQLFPVRTAFPAPITAVSTGASFVCAIGESGAVMCSGLNHYGQLGVPPADLESCDDRPCSLSPVRLASEISLAQLSAGHDYACGLDVDAIAYCWGRNNSGQLGDGTYQSRWQADSVNGGLRFRTISTGTQHTCALTLTDELYCWGFSLAGETGFPPGSPTSSPRRVDTDLMFETVTAGQYRTCAKTYGGDGYCWGRNLKGALGDGTTEDTHVPSLVVGGHQWRQVETGYRSCGITTSGNAFCWGGNLFRSDPFPTPIRIEIQASLKSLTTGYGWGCGLSVGDIAYCWALGVTPGPVPFQLGVGAVRWVPRP